MSALILLLLLPVILGNIRVALKVTGWLLWLLSLAAMLVVMGLLLQGLGTGTIWF